VALTSRPHTGTWANHQLLLLYVFQKTYYSYTVNVQGPDGYSTPQSAGEHLSLRGRAGALRWHQRVFFFALRGICSHPQCYWIHIGLGALQKRVIQIHWGGEHITLLVYELLNWNGMDSMLHACEGVRLGLTSPDVMAKGQKCAKMLPLLARRFCSSRARRLYN
jgi:hypothetical protein